MTVVKIKHSIALIFWITTTFLFAVDLDIVFQSNLPTKEKVGAIIIMTVLLQIALFKIINHSAKIIKNTTPN